MRRLGKTLNTEQMHFSDEKMFQVFFKRWHWLVHSTKAQWKPATAVTSKTTELNAPETFPLLYKEDKLTWHAEIGVVSV